MAAPHQREARKLLCDIASGQRTDAVCRMILEHQSKRELLDAVRSVIREELRSVQIVSQQIEEPEQQDAGNVSDDVLGFLLSLQEEGDDII